MPGRIRPEHLADLYRQAAARWKDAPAFATRRKDGSFEATSFAELYETGLNLATALVDLGIGAREHIGLLADNRLEWILCDCAAQLAGCADVPRGTDVTEADIRYILSHADVRFTFVENLATLQRVLRCSVPGLETIVLMDPAAAAPEGVLKLEDLVAKGAALRAQGDRRVEERMEAVRPDDLFTIIYTSGTTGTPKGVQLTHANMASQIRNLPFPLKQGDRTLSILPIWHSYERVFEMVAISWGACTHYTSLRTIGEDLRTAKPTIMPSAPRLWESLYFKIFANVKASSPIKRSLFKLAYQSTRRVKKAEWFFLGQELDTEGRSFGESFQLFLSHLAGFLLFYIPFRILDPIVLHKLRQVVGGEFRGTISGGGALQPHVDEFFNFIGIPVLEGYGLTETAPVLAVRTWKNLVIGTVGAPYPETEIRIVDLDSGKIFYPDRKRRGGGRGLKGEIHARGPQIMKGYYKDPEGTARVLKDGWLNTGDIGMITFNDCLKILGRSKDTIVLLSGENIEPLPIEGRLTQSEFVEQCMVVGQDQKFLGVLIVPNSEAFRTAGISAAAGDEISAHSKARSIMDAEIRRLVCAETGFKPFERIVAWRFIPKPFEVGDELTSTLKLRRHVVYEKYAGVIEEMYS